MVQPYHNVEISGSRASQTKEATSSSLKQTVLDSKVLCLTIEVVPDQENQKKIIMLLEKILEEQERKFTTLSDQIQMQGEQLREQLREQKTQIDNLHGKVRSIGSREWVNAILYSINGVEKNEAILDKSRCGSYTTYSTTVG